MRWAVSLVVLGLMMAAFHRVTAASPLEARAALALGFLLVAAWLGSAIARRAHVPRVTAFVLSGLLLGPAWLNVVPADEVDALGFVADAAVALIAFAAGSALPLATLRAERPALARLTAGTIAFPFAAVTLVLLTVSPWFPLTVHQPLGNALGVALALGTFAAASSPLVTTAVLDELNAHGPFARTMLAVSVAKDVALTVLLAVVLALARLAGSAGAVHLSVAGAALAGFVGSLAIGAAVGACAALYLRRTASDAALVLVAVALVAALAARVIHGDGLLVALAAGFYLCNFAPPEADRLRAELNRVTGPVYALSFAVAGAGLKLDALADLWPWAVLLMGLRAVALRYGTLWAGWEGSATPADRRAVVTPALAREGWLGLISQSGLVLAVAATARRAFPAWGVSLEALVVAMVAVHEVVGPICLRRALARAGELKEEAYGGEAPVAGGAVRGGADGGVQQRPGADWSAGRLPFRGAAAHPERGAVPGDRPWSH